MHIQSSILLNIFEFCHVEDYINILLTSKRFNKILSSNNDMMMYLNEYINTSIYIKCFYHRMSIMMNSNL
jgi:hypothetical protein